MAEHTSSWTEAIVEGSLNWSFLDFRDLPEVADLCAAMAYFDDPARPREIGDLEFDHAQPHAHADWHAVVGRDAGGTIVAYAWNHITPSDDALPHVWMEIGVHPAWRHHRIGLRLVEWSIDRARTWYRHLAETRPGLGPLWVGMATEENSRVATDLRVNGMLQPQRWFFDAHRMLTSGDLPVLECPASVRLHRFEHHWSEETRQAHNEAFRTRPGAHDVDPASWELSLARYECRPEWSWLALQSGAGGDKVVGYVINSEIHDDPNGPKQGWTERFGVIPEARGQGVGHALLIASMQTFAEQGCSVAGIGVDTDDPERAEALFNSLGYEFDDRVVLFGASFVD